MISIVNTECHVPKTFSDLAKIAAWGRLGLKGTTMLQHPTLDRLNTMGLAGMAKAYGELAANAEAEDKPRDGEAESEQEGRVHTQRSERGGQWRGGAVGSGNV